MGKEEIRVAKDKCSAGDFNKCLDIGESVAPAALLSAAMEEIEERDTTLCDLVGDIEKLKEEIRRKDQQLIQLSEDLANSPAQLEGRCRRIQVPECYSESAQREAEGRLLKLHVVIADPESKACNDTHMLTMISSDIRKEPEEGMLQVSNREVIDDVFDADDVAIVDDELVIVDVVHAGVFSKQWF